MRRGITYRQAVVYTVYCPVRLVPVRCYGFGLRNCHSAAYPAVVITVDVTLGIFEQVFEIRFLAIRHGRPGPPLLRVYSKPPPVTGPACILYIISGKSGVTERKKKKKPRNRQNPRIPAVNTRRNEKIKIK